MTTFSVVAVQVQDRLVVVTDSDVTHHITNSLLHAQSLQPPATTRTGLQVHSVTSVTKPLPEEEKIVTSIHLLSNKCRLHNKDKMSLLLKSSFYLV